MTFRQRSIGRLHYHNRVLACHVGKFAFGATQSGYAEHTAAIVITASEDDLLPVGDQSAQHTKPVLVWVSRSAFSPPINCT